MATLARHPLFGELSRHWKWLLVVGILCLVLGFIGLGLTFVLTLASVLYFGVLMLVAGGAQLVQAFRCSGWRSVLAHVLIALLYVVAGLMVITRPLLASMLLTGALAGMLLLIGVLPLRHGDPAPRHAGLGVGAGGRHRDGPAGPDDPVEVAG